MNENPLKDVKFSVSDEKYIPFLQLILKRCDGVPKTARIPKNILKVIEFRVNKEGLDESTVIRQLLHLEARQYVSRLYNKRGFSLKYSGKKALQATYMSQPS